MKISNNNGLSFAKVYIGNEAFDRALALSRYHKTSSDFNSAKDELMLASKGKTVVLSSWDDNGVCVYEVDGEDKNVLTRDSDFISGLKKAAEMLKKESQPQKPRRKPFNGTLA